MTLESFICYLRERSSGVLRKNNSLNKWFSNRYQNRIQGCCQSPPECSFTRMTELAWSAIGSPPSLGLEWSIYGNLYIPCNILEQSPCPGIESISYNSINSSFMCIVNFLKSTYIPIISYQAQPILPQATYLGIGNNISQSVRICTWDRPQVRHGGSRVAGEAIEAISAVQQSGRDGYRRQTIQAWQNIQGQQKLARELNEVGVGLTQTRNAPIIQTMPRVVLGILTKQDKLDQLLASNRSSP